jgi:hypothetical protein
MGDTLEKPVQLCRALLGAGYLSNALGCKSWAKLIGYQVLFLANLEGINLLPRSDVVSIDISFLFDCFLCILFITAIF